MLASAQHDEDMRDSGFIQHIQELGIACIATRPALRAARFCADLNFSLLSADCPNGT
jgi:hypothetical protein